MAPLRAGVRTHLLRHELRDRNRLALVVQCVVDSAANARSLSAVAAAKSEVIADVNATVERLTAEMAQLQSRCNDLTDQLAEQSAAREARPGAAIADMCWASRLLRPLWPCWGF